MKKILHVEDNPSNRKIVRDLFSSKGYMVIEACDGLEAIDSARRDRPDLILMDIQLPKLDGYETTRLIKADPALKSIPIIAVTSYALSGDDRKAFDAGCDEYIAKPYRPRDLVGLVEKLLAGS